MNNQPHVIEKKTSKLPAMLSTVKSNGVLPKKKTYSMLLIRKMMKKCYRVYLSDNQLALWSVENIPTPRNSSITLSKIRLAREYFKTSAKCFMKSSLMHHAINSFEKLLYV